MRRPYANPAPLNDLELTGRARTHVQDCATPRCTLHPEALNALQAMSAAARSAGIELLPVSSFRDFARQLKIWNDKFSGQRPLFDRDSNPLETSLLSEAERVTAILVWSALPGASRHHWGSDCDLIDRAALPSQAPIELLSADFAADGRYCALNSWLAMHAADFGFFRPYDRDRGGVQPEPWHLSFAPLAHGAQASMRPELLRTVLEEAPLAGRDSVIARLPELFARHVAAVAPTPQTARSAAALSRAARPA